MIRKRQQSDHERWIEDLRNAVGEPTREEIVTMGVPKWSPTPTDWNGTTLVGVVSVGRQRAC